MRKLLIATVAGTVVLIVWGMLFWGFLAEPLGVFHSLPDDQSVNEVLEATGLATGTYFMPWPHNTPKTRARFQAQHEKGPFYRLSYVREGVNPSSKLKLAIGTLHYFGVAAIAVALAVITGGSFASRFGAVLLGGLLGTSFITVGDNIWFHMPMDYIRGALLYEAIAWIMLGLVVARLTRGFVPVVRPPMKKPVNA
jgi:hypothetical protein